MTLDLSVTLISALGCAGLTDRPLHGKMGYPRNLRDWQITHLVEAAGFCELCPVRTFRTAVSRLAQELVGQLSKLLCLHNGRYQP